MQRLPRFNSPGYPLHVVQRGNNRQIIYFKDSDYRAYLDSLLFSRSESGYGTAPV